MDRRAHPFQSQKRNGRTTTKTGQKEPVLVVVTAKKIYGKKKLRCARLSFFID